MYNKLLHLFAAMPLLTAASAYSFNNSIFIILNVKCGECEERKGHDIYFLVQKKFITGSIFFAKLNKEIKSISELS